MIVKSNDVLLWSWMNVKMESVSDRERIYDWWLSWTRVYKLNPSALMTFATE